jgi:hypothetical protein
MSFKAIIQTPYIKIQESLPYNLKIEFTKTQIIIPDQEKSNFCYANFIIKNGETYELIVTDNIERQLRYEIKIKDISYPVRLGISKRNEFFLKWTHNLLYIQKDSSNWLKGAIIGGLFGILMYIISQFIGFKKGYEEGRREGLKEIQLSDPKHTKK